MKKPNRIDPGLIRPAGPWAHVEVSAQGQRFHLVQWLPEQLSAVSAGSEAGQVARVDQGQLIEPVKAVGHGPIAAQGQRTTPTSPVQVTQMSPAPQGKEPREPGQKHHQPGQKTDRVVLLLHGFPQYWWAWRQVLPLLGGSEAVPSYRVLAMDLRGFGGSDKPPEGYHLAELARDVIGVAQGLGATQLVVAGHGLGGAVAWLLPTVGGPLVRGIATLAAPHPLGVRSLRARLLSGGALQYGFMQLPVLPQQALLRGGPVRGLLKSWSGKVYQSRVLSEADRYAQVLRRPLAATAALAQVRASLRMSRTDRALLKVSVKVPVLSLQGEVDPIMPAQAFARDGHYLQGVLQQASLSHCGHFLPEEDPAGVAAALAPFFQECFSL